MDVGHQWKEWKVEEIKKIYQMPFLELIFRAQEVHRRYHDPRQVQISSLISVKTGGCPEDCHYCPQAARYQTEIESNPMLDLDKVLQLAKEAKEKGASRVCLGAAWRKVKDNQDFERILEMVEEVSEMGMEVCCTLGMLSEHQAFRLKEAGVYAYNHNIDTSEDHYKNIISTRKFSDRMQTLTHVRKAKITLCTGGIIGLGESEEDRWKMLQSLANLDPQPESVPINALVPVKGTPLENQEIVPIWDMVRMIATARIIMPQTMVRLSAGRNRMTLQDQALCFLAGANSIFSGEKLLTTPNPNFESDQAMLNLFGLESKKAFT